MIRKEKRYAPQKENHHDGIAAGSDCRILFFYPYYPAKGKS
jgi:hypothetical protein